MAHSRGGCWWWGRLYLSGGGGIRKISAPSSQFGPEFKTVRKKLRSLKKRSKSVGSANILGEEFHMVVTTWRWTSLGIKPKTA